MLLLHVPPCPAWFNVFWDTSTRESSPRRTQGAQRKAIRFSSHAMLLLRVPPCPPWFTLFGTRRRENLHHGGHRGHRGRRFDSTPMQNCRVRSQKALVLPWMSGERSGGVGERLANFPVMSERIDYPSHTPAVRLILNRTDRFRAGMHGAIERSVRVFDDHHHSHRT